MDLIESDDGTAIAVWRSGGGPPLLLVHGAGTDHASAWRSTIPALALHRTVHAMDRRGRGASGDGPRYALEREVEDVVAVIDDIGGAVDVVGHSFGGMCALEAALRTTSIRRLVVYESVQLAGGSPYRPGLLEELDELLELGSVEHMLVTMMREVIGRSDEEIELLRADAEAWSRRLAYAPTIPRELRVDAAYRFDPQRFADLRVPVAVLVGGASAPSEHRSAQALAAALPDARVVVLPEQHHIAMITAPERFVAAIEGFLGA